MPEPSPAAPPAPAHAPPELTSVEQLDDQFAYQDAVWHAVNALRWRAMKREMLDWDSWTRRPFTPAQCEAHARRSEARVRELATQSEIVLQRRADRAGYALNFEGIQIGAGHV